MTTTITLTSQASMHTTIANTFIDDYLPRANGEFLKIYLYLLRWLPDSGHRLSLGSMADVFHMTEADVTRALKYWEQEGLLSLTFGTDGTVTAIAVCDFTDHANGVAAASVPDTPFGQAASEPAASTASTTSTGIHPTYPIHQLQHFQSTSDGEQLIFIIQQYLGHPLSQNDLNMIYYFYDDLGFSTDLIEYLFEYCVSTGHTQMRYIEKVALAWDAQHIHTADEAKTQSEAHQRSCYAVMNAFGLGGRRATSGEVDYVRKWTGTYGFSMELVLEACRRTMMTVHTPSFEYTDKILSNWKSQNVYTMTEVIAADKAHSESKQTIASKQSGKPTRTTGNKFHNFQQRSYDYASLEKKLALKHQTVSDDRQTHE